MIKLTPAHIIEWWRLIAFLHIRKIRDIKIGQSVIDVSVECVIRTVFEGVNQSWNKVRSEGNYQTLENNISFNSGDDIAPNEKKKKTANELRW